MRAAVRRHCWGALRRGGSIPVWLRVVRGNGDTTLCQPLRLACSFAVWDRSGGAKLGREANCCSSLSSSRLWRYCRLALLMHACAAQDAQ